jgi:phenylacetate-coenzyme A ligase PaaK-like adenylate-forming protein
MARFGASTLRWSAANGEGPPARAAWVAARSPRHPSAVAALITGSALIPVDQPIAAIVEQLNAVQPDAIATVCSMLPVLTDEARHGRLRVPVERISVFGDVLDRDAAIAAADVFGVQPVEGYPTTDVGCIAQQAPGEPGLYLNEDLLLVEIVDADDRPVRRGVAGDHLLVTSLHHRTMPLIRYRIDDRLVIDPEPGRYAAYRRLASVDGRSDDVFRYAGVTVHPHVFRTAIGRHLGARDYEVRQTGRGAVVRVVEGASTIDTAALGSEIADRLRHLGLRAPEVDVAVVRTLDRTAVGKRRRFIPTAG